ncbi:calcium-binding protein [Microvirga brassicacearum]|uniref:Calcium-binding protein n=1 Tax=Microvirga brassicacearum TaxID=2580413 RepID=A0A5N3PAH9_9HYPH|nr:hypothetical protein [Microvirga brassicacearum]KAB0266752.1 hypothetical protein FEZ63_12745 [Microvirga brassicacearum]
MPAPVHWGDAFSIEDTHAESMKDVSMTALDDGGFVAVWTHTQNNSLFAKTFNADGTARTSATQIPGSTNPNINGGDVTVMADGSYVVSWGENNIDGTLKAAIFRADGTLLRNTFQLNGAASAFQDKVVVVPLKEGGFMALYSRGAGDGGSGAVLGRTYDAHGNLIKDEFIANGTTAGNQNWPSAAHLQDGNIVVVYAESSEASNLTIRARILKPDGTAAYASEIVVPSPSSGQEYLSSVTALSNGRFVVVWHTTLGDDIRAQVFAANGDRIGGELTVNTTIIDRQINPVVSALADGGFAVAFEDLSGNPSPPEANYDVRVVTFNGAGQRESNDVVVHNTSAGYQGQAHIMTLADGRFVVGWTHDGTFSSGSSNRGAIYGQIFDARIQGVTINGTAANDHYVGSAFGDRLDGGAGNDHLVGGDGHDILYAAAGRDIIDGGEGGDYVDYERSETGIGLTVDLRDQTKNTGDAAGDHYISIEHATGTRWDDVLYGTDDPNELYGGQGSDILVGRDGGDTLDGGDGFDYASYADAKGGVFARLRTAGPDLAPDLNDNDALGDVFNSIEGLIGSAFEDHLWGDDAANVLIGGGDNDQLIGRGGSDTLEGGAGGDVHSGGEGIDYASYANASTGVMADLRNRVTLPELVSTTFASSGEAAGDEYELVEGLIGSAFADVLTGNEMVNTLWGGAGDDRLDGGFGADWIEGGLGNDTYVFDGSDSLVERAGGGTDTVETGIDYTLGAEFEALVATGLGNLALTGNALANAITGNAGANRLNGDAGADTLSGLAGNDTYWAEAGDRVIETVGGGDDTVIASASYSVGPDAEVEVLKLAPASSKVTYDLTGSNTANQITGHAGKNTLKGLGGDDKIWGSLGNDTLYGNGGRDTFVFDTKPGRTNMDAVRDFRVKDDTIWLDNKYFSKLGSKGSEIKPALLSKSAFHIGSAAHDASDRIIYNNKKGILYYDADGDGARAAVQIATVSKHLKMTHKDFYVI